MVYPKGKCLKHVYTCRYLLLQLTIYCYTAEWTIKIGDQNGSSRVQIPLRLAWSISVHKSQWCVWQDRIIVAMFQKTNHISLPLCLCSMTIPNLLVNLSGVFEYGQAYVGEQSLLVWAQSNYQIGFYSHKLITPCSSNQSSNWFGIAYIKWTFA